jgi:hypothetical protein
MCRTMRDRKRETELGQQRIAGDRRNSVTGRNSRDGSTEEKFQKTSQELGGWSHGGGKG